MELAQGHTSRGRLGRDHGARSEQLLHYSVDARARSRGVLKELSLPPKRDRVSRRKVRRDDGLEPHQGIVV